MLRTVTASDIDRMTSGLFLVDGDAKAKASRFWVLLVLAAIIASAGVIADSTATVIGAMIVAPLMTPILGTALALVLSDRRNLVASIGYVVVGAIVVVGIAYLLGLTQALSVDAATNTQVASRISPRLIDLVAALATGVVGAFAQVRSDVSDTLPGVAIAISLVPPLAVVGLALESGNPDQAAGALLLFGTNVAAIVATGTIVFLLYRVRAAAQAAGRPVRRLSGVGLAAALAALVLVAVPLAAGSAAVVQGQVVERQAATVAQSWAERNGWRLVSVSFVQQRLQVTAIGPPPEINPDALRAELDAAGLSSVAVRVTLVVGGSKDFPATS